MKNCEQVQAMLKEMGRMMIPGMVRQVKDLAEEHPEIGFEGTLQEFIQLWRDGVIHPISDPIYGYGIRVEMYPNDVYLDSIAEMRFQQAYFNSMYKLPRWVDMAQVICAGGLNPVFYKGYILLPEIGRIWDEGGECLRKVEYAGRVRDDVLNDLKAYVDRGNEECPDDCEEDFDTRDDNYDSCGEDLEDSRKEDTKDTLPTEVVLEFTYFPYHSDIKKRLREEYGHYLSGLTDDPFQVERLDNEKDGKYKCRVYDIKWGRKI